MTRPPRRRYNSFHQWLPDRDSARTFLVPRCNATGAGSLRLVPPAPWTNDGKPKANPLAIPRNPPNDPLQKQRTPFIAPVDPLLLSHGSPSHSSVASIVTTRAQSGPRRNLCPSFNDVKVQLTSCDPASSVVRARIVSRWHTRKFQARHLHQCLPLA